MAHMNVILTEALQGVGKLGETVRVKAGFARNFLLPRNKAMAATKANAALFAVALLANESPELRQRLEAFRAEQTEVARNMTLPPAA